MAQLKSTIIDGILSVKGKNNSWLDGQKTGAMNISDMSNTDSYWPWISGTNTGSKVMCTIGVLNNRLYLGGSATSRTDNGIDSYAYLDIGESRFYAQSMVTNNWFRSTGQTGWYSQTYGGGWYMTDTTWIRVFGSKSVFAGTGEIRTDGIFNSRKTDCAYHQTHNTSGLHVSFGVGSGGNNHGIYSNKLGKWVIYATTTTNKLYSGLATTLTSSDKRLKTNLNLIQPNKYYNVLDKLKPFSYKFIDDVNGDTFYGFMAQDIERIFEEEKLDVGSLVDEVELEDEEVEGYIKKLGYNPLPDKKRKSVAYSEFVPILWSFAKYHKDAINELRTQNEKLRKEIDDIKAKLGD
jgi:hypothetical protein